MEIQPASMPQVVKGRRGRVVFIDNDALDIARDLRQIHADLRLAWNELGEFFVVYQLVGGEEQLVTTAQQADARLLEHVRRLVSPSYNLAGELDRIDASAASEADWRFAEKVGPIAERLAHAIRKDTHVQNKIIVPRSIT